MGYFIQKCTWMMVLLYYDYKMSVKRINVKNKRYYFHDDVVNLKEFDFSLLELDKSESAGVNIYYVTYDKKHPIYLLSEKIDGFIEENGKSMYSLKGSTNKYLRFAATDDNEEILVRFDEIWVVIK